MTCSHCQGEMFEIVEGVGGFVRCCGCGQYQPAPPAVRPVSSKHLPRSAADQIRAHAERFTTAALILSVFSMVALLAGLATGEMTLALFIAGGLVGTALWLYLIAQVIHIRANTEK